MSAKEAKQTIKEALWQRGFKVRDIQGLAPSYQLIVEGRWHVRVVTGAAGIVTARGCDAVAVLTPNGKKFYALPTRETPQGAVFETFVTNPKAVFGQPSAKVKGRKN